MFMRLKQNQRGQIVVLTAFILPLLFMMFMLVAKAGVLYIDYTRLQNAADIAALAGAEVSDKNIAKEYAKKNLDGIDISDENIVCEPNNEAMTVTITLDLDFGFFSNDKDGNDKPFQFNVKSTAKKESGKDRAILVSN